MNRVQAHASDESGIDAAYREHVNGRTLRFARIGGVLSFIFPVYFLVQDVYLVKTSALTAPWRLLPTLVGMVLLAVTVHGERHPRLLHAVYRLFLMSLMIMMCGLSMIHAGTELFNPVMSGVLVIIFIIFMGAMGGARYIAPIYALPFVIMVAILLARGSLSWLQTMGLTNPAVLIVVATILAELQERLRYREFAASRRVSDMNHVLAEKNQVIEERSRQINQDLELARTIQFNMIPQELPRVPGLELRTMYQPMLRIGGDFYDFFLFKEPQLLGIIVADVTGHGIPAALLTGMIKTLTAMGGAHKLSPAGFLAFLNDRIVDLKSGSFTSAVYVLYDAGTRRLSYARAGHTLPVLVRDGVATELPSRGMLMGVMAGQRYEEQHVVLRAGDKVFLFTDGLIEAENEQRVAYRDELMRDLASHALQPVAALLRTIHERLVAFCGSETFDDDICVVCFEVH